jgi:4-hydroxy-3-methylbut-2-enyl diphosphate reductase
MITVKRAAKFGFCSGVRVAELKARKFARAGGSAAVLGQVVHNERVVEELERLGLRTVAALEEVTEPTVVISAHGVPPSVQQRARELGLAVLDTTCRFVYDIHREARAALAAGAHLAFMGDPAHREVIGYTHDLPAGSYHIVRTLADAHAVDWAAYATIRVFYQTTLNADEFEPAVRWIETANPATSRADTICYATRENQEAARALAGDPEVELVLVVGGQRSANTFHLWEITSALKPSHLIQGAADLRREWFSGVRCVGLTAGASTPDEVVEEVEAAVLALAGS